MGRSKLPEEPASRKTQSESSRTLTRGDKARHTELLPNAGLGMQLVGGHQLGCLHASVVFMTQSGL